GGVLGPEEDHAQIARSPRGQIVLLLGVGPAENVLHGGEAAGTAPEAHKGRVAAHQGADVHRVGRGERDVGEQVGDGFGQGGAVVGEVDLLGVLVGQVDAGPVELHEDVAAAGLRDGWGAPVGEQAGRVGALASVVD